MQKQIVASTRQTFEQLNAVVDKGFVSKVEYERRRQTYITAQQEQSRLAQQLNSISAQLVAADADMGRSQVSAETEVTQVKSSVQSMRQQRSRLQSEGGYVIKAPISGRITAIQTGIGRTVGGPVPLMVIVPIGSPLRAELYAPSRAIGFIRKGQEVRFLYDAFPYQRFGSFVGKVEIVSRIVIGPGELDAPLKIEEPVYRVTATLKDQQLRAFGEVVPFQPGMTLTANIVLDRRSFWDWLMTPFNAVAKRT